MGRIPEEPARCSGWRIEREGDAKKLDELIDQLIRQMIEEGWIQSQQQASPSAFDENGEGYRRDPAGSARFELTDKSIDFLGFRLLRHLLGSLGRSSFGRHETTHFATGVEAYQATKEYEFGDTLNLDISATLLHADRARRPGRSAQSRIRRPDGAAGGIREFVFDRAAARHQSQHDSLRRRSIHSGQARRAGAVASDPHAISGRFAAAGSVSRFGRRSSAEAAGARRRRAVSHEHVRRIAAGAAAVDGGEERHAADRHDHGRQAVRDHAAERPHLQECLRPGSDDSAKRPSKKWRRAARPES